MVLTGLISLEKSTSRLAEFSSFCKRKSAIPRQFLSAMILPRIQKLELSAMLRLVGGEVHQFSLPFGSEFDCGKEVRCEKLPE